MGDSEGKILSGVGALGSIRIWTGIRFSIDYPALELCYLLEINPERSLMTFGADQRLLLPFLGACFDDMNRT